MDGVVIVLFTVAVALADVLIGGKAFHGVHLLLVGEIGLDLVFGLLVWQRLRAIFQQIQFSQPASHLWYAVLDAVSAVDLAAKMWLSFPSLVWFQA